MTDPLIELAEKLEARAEKWVAAHRANRSPYNEGRMDEADLAWRTARDYASRNPAQPDPEERDDLTARLETLSRDAVGRAADCSGPTRHILRQTYLLASEAARALATTGEGEADGVTCDRCGTEQDERTCCGNCGAAIGFASHREGEADRG